MFKKSKIIVGAALLAVSVLSFTLPQQAEAVSYTHLTLPTKLEV